ncbi:hypothetical protein PG987_000599 [Apiospora arundinis]
MDDNEIDESDVDKSQFSDFFDFTYTYNMSLPTEASTEASTKTSKLPSTPHSHTTTSLPSDLAGLVASGTPSIFAVQETNQPSSLAGGDNVGNTGTGFKGTNHALLGLILAFAMNSSDPFSVEDIPIRVCLATEAPRNSRWTP